MGRSWARLGWGCVMHYLSINSHAVEARREWSTVEVAGPRRLRQAAVEVPASMAMV
ncbi:hypothetical protein CASFOL_020234 [Castilleja foliolosa]|uniref:Uncharacterized protein n=1 Tax=Castilleja foliolosa TaxID=1961234 RepID=A0ABD3D4G9_9LAMI